MREAREKRADDVRARATDTPGARPRQERYPSLTIMPILLYCPPPLYVVGGVQEQRHVGGVLGVQREVVGVIAPDVVDAEWVGRPFVTSPARA